MITKIRIENFKSIEKIFFDFSEDRSNILCLLGKNGTGKSSVFKAIQFFFNNINKKFSDEIVIDSINPYIQKCTISITFDISLLLKKSKNNAKLESDFNKIENFLINNYTNNTNEIELKMNQYKDGTIVWNIKNKDICKTLKSSFPLYYIDTRYLDLFTWEKLWEIINDLSLSVPQKNEKECTEILDTAFTEIYGKKYIDSKNKVEKIFINNNISLDKFHFETRYKNAFAMRFGGEYFLLDGKKLDFYSDGTNSYRYLMLLISLIPEISTTSCKFPIIIVDEPEIGLHNSYIIEFVNCICNHIQKRALMLISTHSPKIISELANHKINYVLYKINRFRLHSTARKMNLSWLNNNLSKITIKETECYFSDYLVYVEGETELQVFYNKKINELFPKLSRIHFYSFDSNNERLKKVHSKSLNLGIDYKLIIDMDKIIQYNNKLHFKLNNDQLLNPIKYSNKSFSELFRYYKGNTEIDLLTLRKKILFLLKNQYENAPDKHYISNPDFCELLKSIINYCRFYNTIVNWSTIDYFAVRKAPFRRKESSSA